MGPIKLNIKGLAKFIVAPPARQRKVLRDYKYPDPQGYAQAGYYRDAQEIIEAYHRDEHERDWLLERAADLQAEAAAVPGQRSTRLRSNASAVRSYAKHFAAQQYEVLPVVRLPMTVGQILVSAQPDLHVRDHGRERVIKLEFAKQLSEDELKIESQLLLRAATENGLAVSNADVLCVDCRNGEVYRGRTGSRINADIDAACLTIAAIWDEL